MTGLESLKSDQVSIDEDESQLKYTEDSSILKMPGPPGNHHGQQQDGNSCPELTKTLCVLYMTELAWCNWPSLLEPGSSWRTSDVGHWSFCTVRVWVGFDLILTDITMWLWGQTEKGKLWVKMIIFTLYGLQRVECHSFRCQLDTNLQ